MRRLMDGWRLLRVMAVLVGVCGAAAWADDDIIVRDPWVREMPPVSTVTAGYLTIENHGLSERVLVGGQSPDFASVELHRTVESGGVASMVEQKRIPIAPGTHLEMRPGDYHIMLIGASRTLTAGDTVPILLLFANGQKLEVSATVRKAGSGEHHHHH